MALQTISIPPKKRLRYAIAESPLHAEGSDPKQSVITLSKNGCSILIEIGGGLENRSIPDSTS